ncbi:MAG: hypothetical protein U0Q18_20345 [Bryobacteraceae bacterium]
MTKIRHYPDGTNEDTAQQVNLYYDSYSGAGPNIAGRLAASSNGQVAELYGYTPAGLMTMKKTSIAFPSLSVSGTLNYTYDGEGKPVSVSYPAVWTTNDQGYYVQVPGPVYDYTYDTMGRPAGMTDDGTSATIVDQVQYGPANELLQMRNSPPNLGTRVDTFQYNALLQLTRNTSTTDGSTVLDLQYSYSTTQNNGKITQSQNFLTGETVAHQYDALQRLSSAATTGPQWGLSFTYDGFGNRLSQAVTKGSAPTVYSTYDAATNRITGYTHDANGNVTRLPNGTTLTYDVENREISANVSGSVETYIYGPDGKRVGRQSPDGKRHVFFYGARGERIGPYLAGPYTGILQTELVQKPLVYFGGRRLGSTVDRLGSRWYDSSTTPEYFPYGEQGATSLQDDQMFATYTRDSVTGLDYATHRYIRVWWAGSCRRIRVELRRRIQTTL